MFKSLESAMPRRPILVFNTVVAGVACFAPCQLFTAESNSRQRFPSLFLAAGLLFIIFVVSAEMALAQNAPATPLKLTLIEAVDIALKQNLDIQAANIETAIQQQDRVIARSELLPHATLDANDAVTRYNTKAVLGVQPSIIPREVGPYQAIHFGSSFSTPIFDLTLIRQYQESGHRLLVTQADEQTVREETVLLAVSEYMAHLRALASITAARSRVELADRLAHQAADLLTAGVASKIDVSRAQVRLREEQQQMIDAQRDAETTLYSLKRILSLPDSQQIEFADQGGFFSTPSLDLSDPLSMALKQRPELHSLSESTKAAELAHKAAEAQSLPKVAFDGGWSEQGETFTTSTPGYEYQVCESRSSLVDVSVRSASAPR